MKRVTCLVPALAALLLLSGPATAQSQSPASSSAQMQAAAARLLDRLSPALRDSALFDLADEAARTAWSNLPASLVERRGVRLGDVDAATRVALHDLIRASTSSQGYAKIAGVMWLDDILHDQAAERVRQSGDARPFMQRLIESWTSENYWFSFFGDPRTDARWGWLISGHHMSASFTVADGRVSFTPLFLGAEPYLVEEGAMAGWKVLSHEVERGYELMQALSDDQRERALLEAEVPGDIFEGPGRKASLQTFEGIPVSALTDQQVLLVWNLIREYVNNADHDAAAAQLAEVEADGMDALHFSWIGSTDDIEQRYYYRIHGPSILIEYIRERAVGGAEGAANHIHTIVRNPRNDYGEDWLERHYREHHNE